MPRAITKLLLRQYNAMYVQCYFSVMLHHRDAIGNQLPRHAIGTQLPYHATPPVTNCHATPRMEEACLREKCSVPARIRHPTQRQPSDAARHATCWGLVLGNWGVPQYGVAGAGIPFLGWSEARIDVRQPFGEQAELQ